MIESKERKTVQQENKFYGMSVSSVAATFLVVLSLVFLPMLIENDGAELKLAMKNSQELEQKVKIRLSDLNLEPSVYMEIAKVKTEISNIDQQLIELYSREQAKPNSGEEIKLWNLRASKLHSILKAYNSQSDLYSI